MKIQNILYLVGLILAFIPGFSYTLLLRYGAGYQSLVPQILSIMIFCIGVAVILFTERERGSEKVVPKTYTKQSERAPQEAKGRGAARK
ncbi:MAG: hypothetical protein H5T33_01250 [Candidatus Methanosuratus sp.]|nr:hypothetical protein [Candidatus Methanosuratincola sp.]